METAIFAAGCFWGVESAFAELPGVNATEVGYANGVTDKPTYDDVCNGHTKHAEAVKVDFDPAKTSYKILVEKFFDLHDPTQFNRQGPDYGDQYRSGIFFTSPDQEKTARVVIEQLTAEKRFARNIVTVVEPSKSFYPAEAYHQKYFAKRGGGSCHI